MRTGRKRSCVFQCFGGGGTVSDEEGEVKAREEDHRRRRKKRPLHRRIVMKIFRSSSMRDRSEKGGTFRREKGSPEMPPVADDDERSRSSTSEIFTISTSTSSSTLSSSSSSTRAAAVAALIEPTPYLKKPRILPASEQAAVSAARTNGQRTGFLLLLVCLSMVILFGRVFAIFWTSLWLCYPACKNGRRQKPTPRAVAEEGAAVGLPELRLRKGGGRGREGGGLGVGGFLAKKSKSSKQNPTKRR